MPVIEAKKKAPESALKAEKETTASVLQARKEAPKSALEAE